MLLVLVFYLVMLRDDVLDKLSLDDCELFSLFFLRIQTFYVADQLQHVILQLAILTL